MNLRATLCGLGAIGALSCLGSTAQAQVLVVGGGPVYGPTVVVGRPVVPAVPVAPVYQSAYVSPYSPGYSVGYAGYSSYSAYSPVVRTAYVAPAPVVAYRPVVPAVVPVYPAYRPGVVTTRAYYPGQPVRNALRVIAP